MRHARFDADERAARRVAVLLVGFGVSAATVLLGSLWSGIVEVLYVGNEHLSTRAARISWPSRMPCAFVAGMVVFMMIARLMRHATGRRVQIDVRREAAITRFVSSRS